MTGCLIGGVMLAQLLVRPWSQTNEPLDQRVARDFGTDGMKAPFVHYAVPAMSGIQRLPDIFPSDGKPGGVVRITMARDEFEPGSFQIYPNCDLGKVRLELGEFKQVEGGRLKVEGAVFPKENLDLKVVKVWYQNRNAWYGYFGDTGFKLCPELLLNDEDLIRVDEEKAANYARIRGKDGKTTQQWLNAPRQLDRVHWDFYRGGDAFACMKPGFEDADTLQPVTLKKGAFKQFFLTAHTTKDTAPGLYRGEVKVTWESRSLESKSKNGGEASDLRLGLQTSTIPVEIRVLDFELPKPACYQDANRPFLVNFYSYDCFGMILELNGGDLALAQRQAAAMLKNRAEHGQNMTWLRWSLLEAEGVDMQRMADDVGLSEIAVCAEMPTPGRGGSFTQRDRGMARAVRAARKIVGDRDIYAPLGDEPPPHWLQSVRPVLEMMKSHGLKLILAGSDNVFRKTGYLHDWYNINKTPEDTSTVSLWNQLGHSPRVAWYSAHHVGVENPELNRRQNGMAAYLSGYSCLCNYAHHFGSYNDDSEIYKPMVFTYGQSKGVIDTLQWEGFREGLDDIRYATLLVRLARAAAADTKDMRRSCAGGQALQYLAQFRKDADDLNTCRLEMIRHILKLRGLEK